MIILFWLVCWRGGLIIESRTTSRVLSVLLVRGYTWYQRRNLLPAPCDTRPFHAEFQTGSAEPEAAWRSIERPAVHCVSSRYSHAPVCVIRIQRMFHFLFPGDNQSMLLDHRHHHSYRLSPTGGPVTRRRNCNGSLAVVRARRLITGPCPLGVARISISYLYVF
jgi:hypothetical protein